MQVVVEAVSILLAKVGVDAANRQVHMRQPPSRWIRLLTVNADVADTSAVGFYELFTLHEHAAGTATGIEHAAFVWREHFNKHLNHATGRVELPALLPLGAGEL